MGEWRMEADPSPTRCGRCPGGATAPRGYPLTRRGREFRGEAVALVGAVRVPQFTRR
jgi:hypothetical protein